MEKINSFKDLLAWQEGHKLVLMIYEITKFFSKDEMFGLISQMRRAAVSTTSNVAEGFSRQSSKEKIQFYSIAQGSVTEVQNQLVVSRDVGYLDNSQYSDMQTQSIRVHKLTNGLIKYLKKTMLSVLALLLYLIPYTLYLIPSPTHAFTIAKPSNFLALNTGLVGWWTFDGKDMLNGKALDKSGNNNTGSLVNIATSTFYKAGKIGQGFNFDGSDDYINVPSSASLDNIWDSGGTISFWVKKNSTNNAVLLSAANFPTTGFGIEDDGASSVTFYVFPEGIGGCGTAGNPCFSRSLINDNIWHNVVGVYDPAGSAMKLYLDGVQRDSQTANSASYQRMDNGMLTFGVFNEGGGYMDEAIMWNIPLTAQQINQSYYSNLYKYQTDTWNYITNQTVNVNGTYTYLGYAKDTSGNSNMTETRTLIVNTSFVQAASVNSIPNNVSSLKINSTFSLQTNLTTENLQVRFNVSDPNAGDTLNYSIQWFRNNITNFTIQELMLKCIIRFIDINKTTNVNKT